jgi:hypothetical protein
MCDGTENCGRLTAKDIQKRVPVFTKWSILKKLTKASHLPEAVIKTMPDGNICRFFCSAHLVYVAQEARLRVGVKVDVLAAGS